MRQKNKEVSIDWMNTSSRDRRLAGLLLATKAMQNEAVKAANEKKEEHASYSEEY
jgi:hypothetical protein